MSLTLKKSVSPPSLFTFLMWSSLSQSLILLFPYSPSMAVKPTHRTLWVKVGPASICGAVCALSLASIGHLSIQITWFHIFTVQSQANKYLCLYPMSSLFGFLTKKKKRERAWRRIQAVVESSNRMGVAVEQRECCFNRICSLSFIVRSLCLYCYRSRQWFLKKLCRTSDEAILCPIIAVHSILKGSHSSRYLGLCLVHKQADWVLSFSTRAWTEHQEWIAQNENWV